MPQQLLSGVVRIQGVVVSDSRRNGTALLRAEFAAEVASGFPRLRRIPQTDVIWFLDYFASLPGAEREALLDVLADSAAMAFGPPTQPTLNERGTVKIPPALERMCQARQSPGGKGGTRYTDMKMMCADPALRQAGAYHPSWSERMSALHFQPRPDLLPDPDQMKAAKAPLVRKLVNTALTQSLGLRNEKRPGEGGRFLGRCGGCAVAVHVDFGGMLSQLGYRVTLKSPEGRLLAWQLSYERLWGTDGRWDYLTEENATRCVTFFAEQVAYLADLTQRLMGRTGGGERVRGEDNDDGPPILSFGPKGE
jgi:hypothetical protein